MIREAREAKGLGLRELAQSLDISPTHLSRLETGKAALVSDRVLSALARKLGIDPDALALAFGKLPPDVERYLLRTPEALQSVRALMRRDEALRRKRAVA